MYASWEREYLGALAERAAVPSDKAENLTYKSSRSFNGGNARPHAIQRFHRRMNEDIRAATI